MNKLGLKNEIQDAYNGTNVEELRTKYGTEFVFKYIEDQLCIDCDEFADHWDPEQYCSKHYRENVSEPIRIPHCGESNGAWYRFGEQLASLDDSEVALYERYIEEGE